MKKKLSFLLALLMVMSILGAYATALGEQAEIVDGRFVETRHITVEIFDRNNDGGTTPEDNFYTNYIKEGLLRDHNI